MRKAVLKGALPFTCTNACKGYLNVADSYAEVPFPVDGHDIPTACNSHSSFEYIYCQTILLLYVLFS